MCNYSYLEGMKMEKASVRDRILCNDDECAARGTSHMTHPCVFFPEVLAVTHVDEHGMHWSVQIDGVQCVSCGGVATTNFHGDEMCDECWDEASYNYAPEDEDE